jgi:hypothetical protein
MATGVAISRTDDLGGLSREARLTAMTKGFQSAFAVAVGIAALGAPGSRCSSSPSGEMNVGRS